jgi:hypothetical protein
VIFAVYPGDRLIAFVAVAVAFTFCRFAAHICREEAEWS